jgi:hypothetical protein
MVHYGFLHGLTRVPAPASVDLALRVPIRELLQTMQKSQRHWLIRMTCQEQESLLRTCTHFQPTSWRRCLSGSAWWPGYGNSEVQIVQRGSMAHSLPVK